MPYFWFKSMEIISLPPDDPRDLKIIPAPAPIILPPARTASHGSLIAISN